MIDRNEATKKIKAALKAKTGKTWSVTCGRGTSWGWITVQAPKARRVRYELIPGKENEDLFFDRVTEIAGTTERPGYDTSRADCQELADVFGRHINTQGLLISPDNWELYLEMAEK